MVDVITAGLIVYLSLVILSLLFDAKSFVSYMKDKLLFVDDRCEYFSVIADGVFHWVLLAATMGLLVLVVAEFFGDDKKK